VYAVKAALLTRKPSQITTFVGFPTKSTMLAVLAAANSDISHAMGLSYRKVIQRFFGVRNTHLVNFCIINQEGGSGENDRVVPQKDAEDR